MASETTTKTQDFIANNFDPNNDAAIIITCLNSKGKNLLEEPVEIQILNYDPLTLVSVLATVQQRLVMEMHSYIAEQTAMREMNELVAKGAKTTLGDSLIITEH